MLLAVHSDKIDQRANSPIPAETSAFLFRLLESPVGLVEVAFCEGDPSSDKLTSAGWYEAHDLQRIGQTITRLASRYGDVYISLSQHSTPQRGYSTALPGQFLWLDDLKEIDPTAAMVLETSASNYQALYRIEQAMTATERAEWQRRARACSGADSCSADATHMIRVPGGRNTKRGANWRVRLAHTSDHTYTLAQLAQRWPVATDSAVISGSDVTSLSEGAISEALICITELRRAAHARLGENSLARRTLLSLTEAPSQSEARYRVIYGLCSTGFTDDEIGALIWYWSTQGKTNLAWGHLAGRSTADKLADIARCIAKSRADLASKGRHITIRPALRHRHMSPVPSKLAEPRARVDRPQRLTAAGLLSWLESERAGDRALATQSAIAAHFSCSIGTVKRIEHQLTAAGHIQRRKHGRLTYVILLDHHRGGDDFMRSSSRHDLIKISTNTASECAEIECLDSINTPPYLMPHDPCAEPADPLPADPLPADPLPADPLPADLVPADPPVELAQDGVGGGGASNSPTPTPRTWRHDLTPKELYSLIYGMRDCEARLSRMAVGVACDQARVDLPALPEPEATIYGAPSDPERRRRYYGLLGKAKKAKSAAQRRALEIKARELEEPMPKTKTLNLRDFAAPEVVASSDSDKLVDGNLVVRGSIEVNGRRWEIAWDKFYGGFRGISGQFETGCFISLQAVRRAVERGDLRKRHDTQGCLPTKT